MKHFFLLMIKLYWLLIPKTKRKKCIFRKSCSHYVFEILEQQGFLSGLKAFRFRYNNCRSGFEIFKNPVTSEMQMLLPSNQIIDRDEIAERLLTLNK